MKKIIIKIGIFLLNIIYFFIKLFPTKNRFVYISRQSNDPSIDFLLIKEEIDKRNQGIESVFLCRTLDGGYQSSLVNKMKYAFHMFVQMYYIATSKIVILDTYCIVISLLKHKKNLKIVQIWHSIGTMKKFGYQILDMSEGTNGTLARLMKMHENYDYVLCAGEGYRKYLAEGFGCDESIVKIYPLPRVDLLTSESNRENTRNKIFNKYPHLKDKPNIVYVPTFRKNEDEFKKAVDYILENLDDCYNFIIKAHPLSKLEINKNNVYTCEEFSSTDMLFVADYVISDYSCIIYEAAILNLPIYFYNFDFDEYVGKRGLNIDYEKDLPGVKSKDFNVIMSAIKKEYDFDELEVFRNKYIKQTDHATKDIVDFLLQIMEE
jgi:CDP-ribitol ribitolphosphotransferase